MKDYLHLGHIKFTFLTYPESISINGSHDYAKLKPASGPETLQSRGRNLEEQRFSFKFHNKFCDPQEMYNALREACRDGQILALVDSSPKYYGDYVIADYSKTEENMSSISVDVTLQEVSENSIQLVEKKTDKGNPVSVQESAPEYSAEGATIDDIARSE